MVRAFAQVYRQLEVEHSARAEKQGRACRRQARAIGGDKDVGGELFCVGLAERAQARGAIFLAHFQKQFDVETQLAIASLEGLLQCRQVDQVLALVVGGAAPVPALATFNHLPRRQAGLPLRVIAANHIAVAVTEQRRQFSGFDARGDHQRAASGDRVVMHGNAETQALDMRGDELMNITIQLGQALGLLALGRVGNASAEQGEKGAVVELFSDVFDGVRTATHEGICSRGFEVSCRWQRTVPPSMRPMVGAFSLHTGMHAGQRG